jgi:hypothetical protein
MKKKLVICWNHHPTAKSAINHLDIFSVHPNLGLALEILLASLRLYNTVKELLDMKRPGHRLKFYLKASHLFHNSLLDGS